jgi:hypothetical protein
LLKLGGDLKQQALAAVRRDDLDSDREPAWLCASGRLIAGCPEMLNTTVNGP